MSKKLPNCAFCGRSLAGHPHILMSLAEIQGKPEIGWHHSGEGNDCATYDPLFELCQLGSDAMCFGSYDTARVLTVCQVMQRGEDRVRSNERNWMFWFRVWGVNLLMGDPDQRPPERWEKRKAPQPKWKKSPGRGRQKRPKATPVGQGKVRRR